MTRRTYRRQSGPTGQGIGTALPRHREDAWWRRNLERAARAGFPRTQRGVRSALVMSVWQSDRARWERHLLVSAHVNTAPPPEPLPTFAHEPRRVAVQYQLEATARSRRPVDDVEARRARVLAGLVASWQECPPYARWAKPAKEAA